MLSKNKIKYINSLKIKKYRSQYKQFIAEGTKIVKELIINKKDIAEIYATKDWINNNNVPEGICTVCDIKDIQKISSLKNPQEVLAVVNHKNTNLDYKKLSDQLIITLDNIQDPGNLGTIIRIADWYGIETIICSEDSVDCYNPKVVQATMGAFARVDILYTDIKNLISDMTEKFSVPVYGTFLEGENIYNCSLTKNGIIVMGNEGSGISENVESLVTQKLYIPNFPPETETSESLNISVATAITCSEFRRRFI